MDRTFGFKFVNYHVLSPSSLQDTRTRLPAPAPKASSKAARISAVTRRPDLRRKTSATGEALTSFQQAEQVPEVGFGTGRIAASVLGPFMALQQRFRTWHQGVEIGLGGEAEGDGRNILPAARAQPAMRTGAGTLQ